MKLHDLRPATGAHRPRKRVGRGIAAGGGKTAGRGTKGQKARAGAAIPAWFEGGQTPFQMRIPKLHGFKNRFRIEYEVVNLGRISALVEAGVFEPGELPGSGKGSKAARAGAAPITVNQEILRASGLVSTMKKPLKVLGHGDLSAALFVVADAFSRSAIRKIEAAGGSVQVLEVPEGPLAALGLDLPGADAAEPKPAAEPEASLADVAEMAEVAAPEPAGEVAAIEAPASAAAAAEPAQPKATRAKATSTKVTAKATAKEAAKPAAAKAPKTAAKAEPTPAAKATAKATAKPAAKATAKAARPASKAASSKPAAKATKPAGPAADAPGEDA